MQMVETQTAVVGAGIIGMATALELARTGRVVHVVERAPSPGAEASGAAAGMLAPQHEADGPSPFLELCLEARDLWLEVARDLLSTTGIDPGHHTDGLLHLALDASEWAALQRRSTWQSGVGLPVEELLPAEIRRRFPAVTQEIPGALFYHGDHYIHTTHSLEAYYAACRAADVHFIFGREVTALRTEPDSGAVRVAAVQTDGLEIAAETTLLAAGAWTGQITESIGYRLPVEPVRGQAVLTTMNDDPPEYILSCTDGYIVPREGGEIFIGATSERVGFDRSTTEEGVQSVWKAAQRILPSLKECRPSQSWAGLRPGSPDDLPIIGPAPGVRDLWLATGHYRNGLLLGPLTGLLLCRWMTTGEPGRDMTPFLPDRFIG